MSDPAPPTTGRRKRKWDVAADGAVAAPPAAGSAPVPATAAAPLPVLSGGANAPRLPVRMPTEPEKEVTPTGRLVHKIDINSSPARFYITKGDFQKKVAADTGVTVSTRGMYLQEGGILPIGEEPLFLQLEAEDEEALEKAKAAIQQAMDSIKEPQVFECRLYANFPPASEMRAKGKVLGPRGQFVKYIEQKYGVRVQLKGDRVWGEQDEEHLHLLLAAPNSEQMAAGKKACANLLDHVRNEFMRIYKDQAGPPGHGPPGHGPPGHGPPGHGPPGHGPPGHGPPGQRPNQPPPPAGFAPGQPQFQPGPYAPPPPGQAPGYGGFQQGQAMPPLPQEPPPPPPPTGPPPEQPPPPLGNPMPPRSQPPPPPGQPPSKRQRQEAEDPLLRPFEGSSAPAIYNPQASVSAALRKTYARPASRHDILAGLGVPKEVRSTSTAPLAQASSEPSSRQPFWSVGGRADPVFGGIQAMAPPPAHEGVDKTKASAAKAKEAEFDSFMATIGVQKKP